MTDEATYLRERARAVVKQVARTTGIVIGLAATSAGIYEFFQGAEGRWWFLPAGILLGGVLGVLNFTWLAQTVQRVYAKTGMTPTLANMAGVIITILKLSAIFVVLYVVIKWQVVHIIGLVVGITLCFVAILWEGFRAMVDVKK